MAWAEVCNILNAHYGKNYNGHSYKYEFFANLGSTLAADSPKIDFLEIGSYEGVSLLTAAHILRSMDKLGNIVSIDPYFPDGYWETPPGQAPLWKNSTSKTMELALGLYQKAGLQVELIREKSRDALKFLLSADRKFDVIFVDGMHEGLHPMIDTAFSLALLRDGGLLCLDDVGWPDVKPIAELCSKHMTIAFRTKTQIAYSFVDR